MRDSHFEELKSICNILERREDLSAYTTDGSRISVIPACVALPSTVKEISELMVFASNNHIPVTPRGAGTNVSGGAVGDGIILDLSAMNHVAVHKNYAVAEAGASLGDIDRISMKHGKFFPPSTETLGGTIGGLIAVNATGWRRVRYGPLVEWIDGMEVVFPDGTTTYLRKESFFFRLILGSEGLLGVITRVRIRLHPTGSRYLVRLEMEDMNEVFECIRKFHGHPFTLFLGVEDHPFAVVEVSKDMRIRNQRFCVEDAENLNAVMTHAIRRIYDRGKISFIEDLSIPENRVIDFFRVLKDLEDKYEVEIPLIAHSGGVIHPVVTGQGSRILREKLIEKAVEMDGWIAGESGIGLLKKDFFRRFTGEQLSLLRKIKSLIDPAGIMNFGKFLDI
jgi:glycolate oxidase